MQRSARAEAEPIAARAEVLGHCGNRPQHGPSVGSRGHERVARRPTWRALHDRVRYQRGGWQTQITRDRLANLGRRHELARYIELTGGHRHELDEARRDAAAPGPACERTDLVVVKPADGNRVELDRQPRVAGSRDALEHARKLAAARDPSETIGLQTIETDGDFAEAGGLKRRCMLGKQLAIGRHRDLERPPRARRQRCDLLDELDETRSDEGLSAGEPHTFDPALGEGPHHTNELCDAQLIASTRLRDPGFREAVGAPQVTAVRHRHAEIANRARELVDKRTVAALLRA